MAKKFKSKRAELNSAIYNLSKSLSPADEPKFAFINAYASLYGEASESLSIKEIPEEQAEAVFKAMKLASPYNKTIQTVAAAQNLDKEKMSHAQKSALIAIFNSRYDGNYKKIFEGLKKYAPGVIKKMTEADVRNTYLVSFWNVITFTEAHQLIKRFDAVRTQESKRK